MKYKNMFERHCLQTIMSGTLGISTIYCIKYYTQSPINCKNVVLDVFDL